jgi:hypothetical protein
MKPTTEDNIMRVKPNESYKLLGTNIVLDKDKTYQATLAYCTPNNKERKAIFVDGMLLEEGEYTIVEASPEPNKKLRPDFDYSCECGYYVCNECGYPMYPMEVEQGEEEHCYCEECPKGTMVEYIKFD